MTANVTNASKEVKNILEDKTEFRIIVNNDKMITTHDENYLRNSFFDLINKNKSFVLKQSKRKVYYLVSGENKVKIESETLIKKLKETIK